ncbi:MAG: RNA-binding protein [Actinobacteria bacterium]|nr:RNA-binding protein [Actinomycetota bacterium]MBL7060798.1 RNA-binding protein [Actinomycetota bacterium]
MKELFSSEGSVTYVKVIRTLEGKSKGFGFVEMETEEAAIKTIKKYNQSSLRGRIILVNEAKHQVNRSFSGNSRRYKYNRNPNDELNSKLRRLRKRY